MPSRAEEIGKANKWFRENLPEIVAHLKENMKTSEPKTTKKSTGKTKEPLKTV